MKNIRKVKTITGGLFVRSSPLEKAAEQIQVIHSLLWSCSYTPQKAHTHGDLSTRPFTCDWFNENLRDIASIVNTFESIGPYLKVGLSSDKAVAERPKLTLEYSRELYLLGSNHFFNARMIIWPSRAKRDIVVSNWNAWGVEGGHLIDWLTEKLAEKVERKSKKYSCDRLSAFLSYNLADEQLAKRLNVVPLYFKC